MGDDYRDDRNGSNHCHHRNRIRSNWRYMRQLSENEQRNKEIKKGLELFVGGGREIHPKGISY